MKILVINAGSSSLKYQLIETDTNEVLAKGLCERIGIDGLLNHTSAKGEIKGKETPMKNHADAIKAVIESITSADYGCISSLSEIDAVGHRVVHGSETFSGSVMITDAVMQSLEECAELAPLHNPPNIVGINACKEVMGDAIPQVGVFDTAFHQTMPERAYLYGLPYEYYEKYKIRRFGFHGTSHRYVSERAAKMLGKDPKDCKIITCHLGNGSSITAVDGGISVDTTMGFTPLEGLPMGTRCGSVDPAIVTFLMEKEGLDTAGVNGVMNKKSGVLGLSGVSSDFRDLEEAAAGGNRRAAAAIEVFAYSVKKYIGAYAAAMGGVDAVVFTAGIGENGVGVRAKCVEGLEFLGLRIDAAKNKTRGKEIDISTEDARVRTLIIPTNEELMIALDTQAIAGK
ncbi:MAG: acetate kinase [Clostridiales bacterium]|nr:acetate kinase [Clostridiales bacterium]